MEVSLSHLVFAVNQVLLTENGKCVFEGKEGKGVIHSIPQISGGYGTELSHEAAIGKIAKDKIEYLMTRRMTEDEAISVIIRGFLNVKVQGIPRSIQAQMDEIIEQASKEGF